MRLDSNRTEIDNELIEAIFPDSVYKRNKLKSQIIRKSKSKRIQAKINELDRELQYPDNPYEKVSIKIKKPVKEQLEKTLYNIIIENPKSKINSPSNVIASYLLIIQQFDNDFTLFNQYKRYNRDEESDLLQMAEYVDSNSNEYAHIKINRITLFYLRCLKYSANLKNDTQAIYYLLALFSQYSKYYETIQRDNSHEEITNDNRAIIEKNIRASNFKPITKYYLMRLLKEIK